MSQDSAMRARVEGRDAVAARTVWQVEIGPVRARCVACKAPEPGREYEVQLRDTKGWKGAAGFGSDPYVLLVRLIGAKTVKQACER